jgi:hypothetical protein
VFFVCARAYSYVRAHVAMCERAVQDRLNRITESWISVVLRYSGLQQLVVGRNASTFRRTQTFRVEE